MTRFFSFAVLFLVTSLASVPGMAQNISTVAGGIGTAGPATSVGLSNPYSVAVDSLGNIYVADQKYNVVRKLTPAGSIRTIAGNGTKGYGGNGGPGTNAVLSNPMGVATDLLGNVYVSDFSNSVVRKIDAAGVITVVAGNGTPGFSGDGFAATAAQLYGPEGLCLDKFGNLYISDFSNNRVRKVSAAGNINTIAGNGTPAFSGDSSSSTAASLFQPCAVSCDSFGNIFIVDQGNVRVRKINPAGNIYTIAGTGTLGYSADGTLATAASLSYPTCVTNDHNGRVYIADKENFRVRYIDATGRLQTFAGGGPHHPGDGLLADSAMLFRPSGICFDRWGKMDIAIGEDFRVSQVDTFHIINTIAGTGIQGLAGDGGQGTSAQIPMPYGVAVDANGNIFVSEYDNNIIRKISNTGVTSIYAGTGQGGFSGEGGPATDATIFNPNGIAVGTDGDLYVADFGNGRIRRISAITGILTTVAGNGSTSGPWSDGVPATTVALSYPVNLNFDRKGNMYISDWGTTAIRMVDTLGIIHHIAGCGFHGFGGDNGPATAACINSPFGICVDTFGNVYIGDANNFRIRKIDVAGNITTIAGNGTNGYSGDLGVAAHAKISYPYDIKAGPDGNIYFADGDNNVVRMITPDTIITTVTGNGVAGFTGDGALATAATLNSPMQLAFDPWGNYYIADMSNNRIRKVGNNVPNTVVNDYEVQNSILVYPDPNSGSFSVLVHGNSLDDMKITLTDMTGRETLTEKGKVNVALHVETNQPAGIYVLTASTPSHKYYQKVAIGR